MKYSPVDPPVAAPSSARHMVIVHTPHPQPNYTPPLTVERSLEL